MFYMSVQYNTINYAYNRNTVYCPSAGILFNVQTKQTMSVPVRLSALYPLLLFEVSGLEKAINRIVRTIKEIRRWKHVICADRFRKRRK
jgi:hypothetical protein